LEFILKINPVDFASRLNEACDHFGLPPKNKGRIEKLADLIGVSKMSVSYWFDAKFLPSRKKRDKIASILGVSKRYLELGEGSLDETDNHRQLKPYNYKLIKYNNYDENHEFKECSEVLIEMDTYYPDAFASIVYDNSMYPIYPANTLALINPCASVKNNSIVAAYIKTENKLIFRQFFDAGHKRFLSPVNDDYQTYTVSDNVLVIGLVVYVQMSSLI